MSRHPNLAHPCCLLTVLLPPAHAQAAAHVAARGLQGLRTTRRPGRGGQGEVMAVRSMGLPAPSTPGTVKRRNGLALKRSLPGATLDKQQQILQEASTMALVGTRTSYVPQVLAWGSLPAAADSGGDCGGTGGSDGSKGGSSSGGDSGSTWAVMELGEGEVLAWTQACCSLSFAF